MANPVCSITSITGCCCGGVPPIVTANSGAPNVLVSNLPVNVLGDYIGGHWWPGDPPIWHPEFNGTGNGSVLACGRPIANTIAVHSCGEITVSPISSTVMT